MNTITLAELYNQQYLITRVLNGNAFFLQENDTGFGFNLEDDKGNIVAKDLPKDKILNVDVQGVIVLDGRNYQIHTNRKNQPSPKLTRNIVTAYLSKPNDESDLTNDDRIHIFKTILAGSSDLSLDLFKDVCSEYDVDFNQLNKNSGLMLALINATENTISSTVPTVPVFETKFITWEQLTQVVDVLFDHDNSPFPLEDIKTSRSVTEPVEVLPDNRIIVCGQIYTPKCYVVPEVYSL